MVADGRNKLPRVVENALWITVGVMFVSMVLVGSKQTADNERAAIRQVYQDGYNAGSAGVALECPWSTWYTDARVEWNRGYVAGAVSRNTPRNAAD